MAWYGQKGRPFSLPLPRAQLFHLRGTKIGKDGTIAIQKNIFLGKNMAVSSGMLQYPRHKQKQMSSVFEGNHPIFWCVFQKTIEDVLLPRSAFHVSMDNAQMMHISKSLRARPFKRYSLVDASPMQSHAHHWENEVPNSSLDSACNHRSQCNVGITQELGVAKQEWFLNQGN